MDKQNTNTPTTPLPELSKTDWTALYNKVSQTNKANRFINYRYNVKDSTVTTSWAGCVGTDEDGKPIIQPDIGICGSGNDPTNNSNPCKVDANMHSPETCKLTVGMLDADKKFKRYQSGASVYKPGLPYTVYYGSMRGNYDLFFADAKVWFTGISTNMLGLNMATNGQITANVNSFGGGYTGGGYPGPGTPEGSKAFTIEWFGYFRAPKAGDYIFQINSDDASLLYIDNAAMAPSYYGSGRNVFIDNGGGHGMINLQNTYKANDSTTYHPIRIRYEEGWGGYEFEFKILDSQNQDITANSIFYKDSASSTFYSLVRNKENQNMYDCYMTNNADTVSKTSTGKRFKYEILKRFGTVNVDGKEIQSSASWYAAVGDDGTIQLYDAAKSGQSIDFNGTQARDGNHPDFLARLNGPLSQKDVSYWIQGDGNMRGDSALAGGNAYIFLSWQNWLGYNENPGPYTTTNNKLAQGAFYANQFDYTYNQQNPFKRRNIIVHKNNPYNEPKMNYHIISDGGNYKFRMSEQGELRLIYAVRACGDANSNGINISYTENTDTFSFYNVNADPRLNKSFYYDSSDNSLSYIDRKTYSQLYVTNKDGSDYSSYESIYLPKEITDAKSNSSIKTGYTKKQCQEVCNSNENCNYYYYQSKSDGSNSQCYIDNGTHPFSFTPSTDPSGGDSKWIKDNPGSLNIKEKTILVTPSMLTSADGTNPNVIQTDYGMYQGAKMNFQPYAFYNKVKPDQPYANDELRSVVVDELNYYYNGGNGMGNFNGGYDPNNVTQVAVPAGEVKDPPPPPPKTVSTFVGEGSSIKEGLQASDMSTTDVNQTDNSPVVDNSVAMPDGFGAPNLASSDNSIESVGPDGEKITSTTNKNPWSTYLPPLSSVIVASNSNKNVSFYNAIINMIQNVVIHLPMYGIESDNGAPCVKNRGYYGKNYESDGTCPNKYKIAFTQADRDDPRYSNLEKIKGGSKWHAYVIGDTTNFIQNDDKVQFSEKTLQFHNPCQWLQIKDPISWPKNYLTFSFYFKLSPAPNKNDLQGNPNGCPRVFDFSNGQKDYIFAYFRYQRGTMNLGFGCLGYDVYRRGNAGANDSGICYEDYFEGVDDDKWHFCEWRLFVVGGIPSPNPKNKTVGMQMIWQLALHTLENNGSITAQYFTIFDSTFSNYRDERDKRNHPERSIYIDPMDGSAFTASSWRPHPYDPNAYITRNPNDKTTNLDYVNVQTRFQTRDYVGGLDNICIVQNIAEHGLILHSKNDDNKYKLHPFKYNTCRARLSFPYVPTSENYIACSSFFKPERNWYWDLFFSNKCCIRDFKMIVDQPTIWPETQVPGSFNWCYFNKFHEWMQNTKNTKPLDKWPATAWNIQQMWMHQPIVEDGDSGVFTGCTLPKKFLSPNSPVDPTQITRYNPLITNNMANFIYSQIIYPGELANKMSLRPYLQNMSNIEPFQNMEGFTDKGMMETSDLKDSNGNPNLRAMTAVTDKFLEKTNSYKTKLSDTSRDTILLKNYLKDYDTVYNSVNDANNDFYDFSGNNMLYYNNKDIPSLRDTKIADNQQFIMQHNTINIIGTITCATMILAAIILARQ
jgi:hypothetical protein